jgi:hypothetical protein
MNRSEILAALNSLSQARPGDYGRVHVFDSLHLESEEHGVIIRVTDFDCDIFLPTIRWDGHTPISAVKLWRSTRLPNFDTPEQLFRLVEDGIQARRDEFHVCRFCQSHIPPERRFQPEVCHGCAERHLGIVF